MARTLLYDPGMVGLPSVLVGTPMERAPKARACRALYARAHTPWEVAAMVGCCWWMMM